MSKGYSILEFLYIAAGSNKKGLYRFILKQFKHLSTPLYLLFKKVELIFETIEFIFKISGLAFKITRIIFKVTELIYLNYMFIYF